MKQKLDKQVQAYSYDFRAMGREHRQYRAAARRSISHDTESVLPEADKIIARRGTTRDAAATALAASRARTRQFIIWVGLAAVLIGLGCSWRIGRSITGR